MLAVTSDTLLIQKYASVRDAEALAELVRRYSPMVFSVAKRVTRNAAAEDVVQECFFELAQKADRIKGSLAGWLYQTAMHRSIDVLSTSATRTRCLCITSRPRRHEAWHPWLLLNDAIRFLPIARMATPFTEDWYA